MEKKMEHEMETREYIGIIRFYLLEGDYTLILKTLNSSFHFLFHYPYITTIKPHILS